MAVILLSPTTTKETLLFFLWYQTLGTSLALGVVTGEVWAGHAANILTWCAVAFAIHFHLFFPFNHTNWHNNSSIFVIYGIAASGILFRLVIATEFITVPNSASTWYAVAFYTWILIGLTVVMLLLIRAYRHTASPVTKRQIGMVTLSGLMAGMPLLSLSVFPKILLDEMLLPAQIALSFLVVIPIGYGYAIRKHQFIRVERYVSRSATAIYVTGLLCFFYFGIIYAAQNLLHHDILTSPLTNLLIILTLVLIYNPLYRRLQNLVDYLLYGGWYDYPTVVNQVTHELEETADIDTLAETLSVSVQKAMRVHWVYLLWQGKLPKQTTSYVSDNTQTPIPLDGLKLANLQNISQYLKQKSHPIDNQTIQRELPRSKLSSEEKQLLESGAVRLWVPIRGLENSLGLLLLGPKYGGDLFNTEDMGILNVISRQAGVILQNVQLISELEEKARENERYQKEINRTREEERKRIARELHDQVIQHLIGLKYQMAQIEVGHSLALQDVNDRALVGDLQEKIGELIQTTRLLCQDLRPAALDLGLVSSIRSLANRFEMESDIGVSLTIEGDRAIPVDEDLALCLFRCAGEALTNTRKHASATQIAINLSIRQEQLKLSISDNGLGFVVPARLGSLMEQDHFGLVGMRERVELLNGTFEIASTPGSGTSLEVIVPFANHDILEEKV